MNSAGTDVIDEFNDALQLANPSIPEPILIATNGSILAGIGRWRSAIFNGTHELNCIEYQLSEDESLRFIISHHRPQRGWNAFIRIRLALKLEPYFRQRALDNMSAGGKYKGWANLPEAQHIEVRQEVARVAGVGARSVRTILQTAHPRLIDLTLDQMEDVLVHLERCWWSVKVQSSESKDHRLRYDARYLRRPPIALRRITNLGERSVTFSTRDKKSGFWVEVECSLEEFVDRWAQHISEHYQHGVR